MSLKGLFGNVKRRLGQEIYRRFPKLIGYFGFSGSLIIEPTNTCNLKCPVCPTSQNMKRPKGLMGIEDFNNILNQVSDIVNLINFGFSGEPLLNRHIFKMVKSAESRNIETSISTNTTFLHNYFEQVFDSNLSNLIVCLDGVTPDAHEAYRIGSDFYRIRENIIEICRLKRMKKAKKPLIILQFLVMKQNEHEVEAIKELSQQWSVDRLVLKTFSLGSWLGKSEKYKVAQKYLPKQKKYQRFTIKNGGISVASRPPFCPWLRQSVIYWNGDVTMCCYDFNGEMVVGNVFSGENFKTIWRSHRYLEVRRKVLKNEYKLCQMCNLTSNYTIMD